MKWWWKYCIDIFQMWTSARKGYTVASPAKKIVSTLSVLTDAKLYLYVHPDSVEIHPTTVVQVCYFSLELDLRCSFEIEI